MPLNTADFPYMDKDFRAYRLTTKWDENGSHMNSAGRRYSIYRQFQA